MLVGLLRTILIIVAVYYLVKFVIWLFREPAGTNRSAGQYNQEHKKKKEGEITIDFIPENKKHIQKDSGDYIDFEEIKEE
ncbi:MAG: hypothetical protein JSV24_11380 [Bacteroidales bacterium]|nr:MAG: hypothetical protein JSV24_11380 [Bacteroidales bacterium]